MMAINPRDGTDCLLGAMDHNRDGTMYWLTGKPLNFTDWKNEEESAGRRRLHMNLDKDFQCTVVTIGGSGSEKSICGF